MTSFRSKKISNPLSLGERLKAQRQKLNISLSQAARETSISLKYLSALESGSHQQLPGEVYAKSFLKVYTKFLGLEPAEFLALFQTEQKIYIKTNKDQKTDFSQPVERVSRFQLTVTPKILRGLIVLLLAISVLVYLGVKIKAIVTPPILLVETPVNNLVIDKNFIEVVGQTEPEVILKINGQSVIANQSGYFSEGIDLQTGVNIIEITAEKRHGQQTKVYRQVVVNENNQEIETQINQEAQSN